MGEGFGGWEEMVSSQSLGFINVSASGFGGFWDLQDSVCGV
jgi:hypothetical protein